MFESLRQVLPRECFQRPAVQQTRPKNRSRHISELAPIHSRRKGRTNDAADAGSCNYRGLDPNVLQNLDYSNMSEPASGASTKGNADTLFPE